MGAIPGTVIRSMGGDRTAVLVGRCARCNRKVYGWKEENNSADPRGYFGPRNTVTHLVASEQSSAYVGPDVVFCWDCVNEHGIEAYEDCLRIAVAFWNRFQTGCDGDHRPYCPAGTLAARLDTGGGGWPSALPDVLGARDGMAQGTEQGACPGMPFLNPGIPHTPLSAGEGDTIMKDRVTCGDVGFKDEAGKHQSICGPERVALLRAFYLNQSTLPLSPCDLRMGQGRRTLEWSDVAWETCGPDVTLGVSKAVKP